MSEVEEKPLWNLISKLQANVIIKLCVQNFKQANIVATKITTKTNFQVFIFYPIILNVELPNIVQIFYHNFAYNTDLLNCWPR